MVTHRPDLKATCNLAYTVEKNCLSIYSFRKQNHWCPDHYVFVNFNKFFCKNADLVTVDILQ